MVALEIEEALIDKLRELPKEKQREVLDFAGFLLASNHRLLRSGCTTSKWRDLLVCFFGSINRAYMIRSAEGGTLWPSRYPS
jgi:hypothetical protein